MHHVGNEYLYKISYQVIQELYRHFTPRHKCHPSGGARGKAMGIAKVIRIHCAGVVPINQVDIVKFNWKSEIFDLLVALRRMGFIF